MDITHKFALFHSEFSSKHVFWHGFAISFCSWNTDTDILVKAFQKISCLCLSFSTWPHTHNVYRLIINMKVLPSSFLFMCVCVCVCVQHHWSVSLILNTDDSSEVIMSLYYLSTLVYDKPCWIRACIFKTTVADPECNLGSHNRANWPTHKVNMRQKPQD